MILDQWEQENVFDAEFSYNAKVNLGRAKSIRLAYDAYWQTLTPLQALQAYGVQPVSPQEQQIFTSFHPSLKQTYSCFLPGEVVRACVDEMRMGNIDPAQMLGIRHLIVDEYQDLNRCDQEFVQRITDGGASASLFVAGDDDQSIYSFRYAAPDGIQKFDTTYPGAATHQLQDCFRCTPAVLDPALKLIAVNPNRLPKALKSAYISSNPPVRGSFHIWKFRTGIDEARAIAQSCSDLIAAGIEPEEILILVCNTRVQLGLLLQEMQAKALPFEQPRVGWMLEGMGRLVLSILRILKQPQDYVAHRTILGLQHRIGVGTCASIAEKVASANLNFHDLFYGTYPSKVFSKREDKAIQRVAAVVKQIANWDLMETLQTRASDIETIIANVFDAAGSQSGQAAQGEWQTLVSLLPAGMNLEELLSYLWSDTEAGQLSILDAVYTRLGLNAAAGSQRTATNRIRILTMHGAKGLDGCIVFIPGLEDGLIPDARTLRSPGLLYERRRLLYVSITRARAACILTLAEERSGAQAFTLASQPSVRQTPSLFLNDIGVPVARRTGGLSPSEVTDIANGCANLF